MNDDQKVILSSLSRRVGQDEQSVDIEIYRAEDEQDWYLEIIDLNNNATVWDDPFDSEEEALEEALSAIKDEGIDTFIGAPV